MKKARELKNMLPTAFPNMMSAALPSCVQQVNRKANDRIGRRLKDENLYVSSDVFGVLADLSFVFHPEFAVCLTFRASGCERFPPPRCLHLADSDFDSSD